MPELPVGIKPRLIWLEERRDMLYSTIERYRQAKCNVVPEWLDELSGLEREIQNSNPIRPKTITKT